MSKRASTNTTTSTVGVNATSNSIHFLVPVYTMMISTLTSSRYREANASRMPCSNTSNLSETFVCFPWQLLGSPPEGHTSESFSFGDTNDINHLILSKHRAHRDGLLEMFFSPVYFVCNSTTIDLVC